MAKRKAPSNRAIPMTEEMHESKEDKMMSEMHDALYTLGNKVRKPLPNRGDKLLPKSMRTTEPNGAKQARAIIAKIHKAVSSCTED